MITFESISKVYGSTSILENASFALSEKERTGLIGCNGSGKTTLLRMLTGEEQPDSGKISKPSDLSIGYLPQEIETLSENTALEIVLKPFKHLLSYEEKIKELSRDSTSNDRSILQQIDSLHTAMEVHDVYSLHSRAEAILVGLGLTEVQWLQPVRNLSGGFRMRAILGQLLLLAPDFLLLDEPTNHLDMDSLVWLEKYLLRIKSGMLIVSHDRDFLNRITTCTAGLSNRSITVANGNYDQFHRLQKEKDANEANRVKNLAIKIAQNERFVERFKAKATKATQAQSRIKLLEKLRSEMPEPSFQSQQRTIRFSFPTPSQAGTVPFQLTAVSAGYNDTPVLDNVSMNINRGDKIAIIGPNGSGKTTLLKLIYGILPPLSGSIVIGNNVIIRYFGQHQLDQLEPQLTVYETVSRDSVNTEKTFIRNILGAFLFSGDSVDKTTGVLSGGEKSRLVLATILASPGNVLLLDEPTNHLDISSIEMLADAMANFTGTILFVSHDDYFISRVANRIIEMRPGLIRDFPGTLTDYRYYLENVFNNEPAMETEETPLKQKTDRTQEKEQRMKDREKRKRLQRNIEKCEKAIAAEEQNIKRIEEILHDPENALNHELLLATTNEYANAKKKLEKLMKEWENLHGELESL